MANIDFQSKPCVGLHGQIRVSSDKSISHRALMLASLATGTSKIKNFLASEDTMATLNAMRQLGVKIEGPIEDQLMIHGVGMHGLKVPETAIDLGNSGTAMRLLTGILSAQSFASELIGDESLSKRPMARITKPLTEMAANIKLREDQFAPIKITPVKALKAIQYRLPMASAQVKSAILFAGLYAQGETKVIEPALSRDHTERMLQQFGVPVLSKGNKIILNGPVDSLSACQLSIPGDISSAAFFIVAASIIPGSDILLQRVGVNPSRIGVVNILRIMGAKISIEQEYMLGEEPVADIRVQSANLHGINIPIEQVALAIDEFPAIFIACACASGQTVLHGAKELRVKESDRIQSMAIGLQALGVQCQALPDGIIIEGGEIQGGTVDSYGDHRIAMAFAVAGSVAQQPVIIKNCNNIATSFPAFVKLARKLGMKIETN